uniref:Uncharacterized protein n=1 Tax=viral metagenome TaxID=1070528 RepID=A0A6C0DPX4_9ZZZZ
MSKPAAVVENEERVESNETVALAVVETVGETLERDVVAVKKCGSCLSKDARWCFHCCIKSWSCTLKLGECCCGGLSACCLFCGDSAKFCKNCMNDFDCDDKN